MKKLRYGIVSASSIVPRFIKAVQSTDHSEIIAIASQSNKGEAIAQEHHIPKVYHSYHELYLDEDVDIVYIANINDQHATEIRNALLNSKHVLCEKPFVLDPSEVIELFELAQKQGKFLMEAQKAPFLEVTQHLKKMIDEEQLGKLYQIQMNNSYAGRFPEGHWMHQGHQGGIWIPSANYILEYLHTLLGYAPLEVSTQFSTYSTEKTLDEVHLIMRYPMDVFAITSLSIRLQTDDITKFFFEKGFVEIHQNWKARSLKIHRHNTHDVEVIHYPCDYELVYEVNHVFEQIKKGNLTSEVMTPTVTYECVSLVHEIYLMSQAD